MEFNEMVMLSDRNVFGEDTTKVYRLFNDGALPDIDTDAIFSKESGKDTPIQNAKDALFEKTFAYLLDLLKTGQLKHAILCRPNHYGVREAVLVDHCGTVLAPTFRYLDSQAPVVLDENLLQGWYDHIKAKPDDRHGYICIVCSKSSEYYKNIYAECILKDFPVEEEKVAEPTIHMLERTGNGSLALSAKPIKKVETDDNVLDLYNTDLAAVDSRIKENLVERDTGLYLFHGEVGTGKTSYIRHLIAWMVEAKPEKKVIYLPPNMVNIVSDSAFVSLLSDHPNSIVVIEDAENILRTREAGGNSAVANILNSTDGLLGDVLKAQFICTFNAPREDMDSALFRAGRLVQEYPFEKLKEGRAKSVWVNRFGHPVEEFPNRVMSLAELFNYEGRIEYIPVKQAFGFV